MNRLPNVFEMDRNEIAKSAIALGSLVLNGAFAYKLFNERRNRKEKKSE